MSLTWEFKSSWYDIKPVIQQILDTANVSKTEVARVMGVDVLAIHRWLKNTRAVQESFDNATALLAAVALGKEQGVFPLASSNRINEVDNINKFRETIIKCGYTQCVENLKNGKGKGNTKEQRV